MIPNAGDGRLTVRILKKLPHTGPAWIPLTVKGPDCDQFLEEIDSLENGHVEIWPL